MPVHDWTRVDAGIFHDFHTVWISEIRSALNEGLLPEGYYALTEQHAGQFIADVLTLHTSQSSTNGPGVSAPQRTTVLATPPKVRRKQVLEMSLRWKRRTLAVRHISGHRLVALIEIVSPANKDRAANVTGFAEKVGIALDYGVHVMVVDVIPPGEHDPQGMHGAIKQLLEDSEAAYDLPSDEPMTLASYTAGVPIDAHLEHAAVGTPLPEMPLFLTRDRYIYVPLEPTYQAAYKGLPAYWRGVLEGRSPQGS